MRDFNSKDFKNILSVSFVVVFILCVPHVLARNDLYEEIRQFFIEVEEEKTEAVQPDESPSELVSPIQHAIDELDCVMPAC